MSVSNCSTPASFIDDGVDFEARVPASAPIDVAQWIDSSSTIINTNSYIDDGADLLIPDASAGPAFGERNRKYYEDHRPKSSTKKEKIHPDVLRAADEQIKNLMRGKRALGKFKVKGEGKGKEKGEGEGGVKPVRIHVRKRQPTFVLHGEGGHVVVVEDDDDPIDSRPPPELLQMCKGQMRKGRTEKDKQREQETGFDGQNERVE